MRIYKEFFFEAAHWLPSASPGHPNARVHGHSFRARVTIDGEPDPATGVLLHFDDIEEAVADARDKLDHRVLNDVGGLESSSTTRPSAGCSSRSRSSFISRASAISAPSTRTRPSLSASASPIWSSRSICALAVIGSRGAEFPSMCSGSLAPCRKGCGCRTRASPPITAAGEPGVSGR